MHLIYNKDIADLKNSGYNFFVKINILMNMIIENSSYKTCEMRRRDTLINIYYEHNMSVRI